MLDVKYTVAEVARLWLGGTKGITSDTKLWRVRLLSLITFFLNQSLCRHQCPEGEGTSLSTFLLLNS